MTATPEMLAQRYDTVGKPSENVRIKYPNSEGHGELLIKQCDEWLFISNRVEDGYFKTGDIALMKKGL